MRGDEVGVAVLVGDVIDQVAFTMYAVGAAAAVFDEVLPFAPVGDVPSDPRDWLAAALVACRDGDDVEAANLITRAVDAGDAVSAMLDVSLS